MSLLSQAFEPFYILDKTTAPDGYGGVITTWTDGAEFDAAAVLDASPEARVAEAQGIRPVYTITTHRSVILRFGDVVKRDRDDKTFRIKSDGDDKLTPNSATLDMRQVTAEEWGLPSG